MPDFRARNMSVQSDRAYCRTSGLPQDLLGSESGKEVRITKEIIAARESRAGLLDHASDHQPNRID